MDTHLRMHPSLDTPEVRTALSGFEQHRSQLGQRPWSSRAWQTNLTQWERKGQAWLIAAIETATAANKCTPFESTIHVNGDASKPVDVPRSGLLEMERTNRGRR